jgi:hypothetical protein
MERLAKVQHATKNAGDFSLLLQLVWGQVENDEIFLSPA